MNNLQIFKNDNFGEVRTIEFEGRPYFVGVDIAKALGYVKPSQAVIDHCKGIRKMGIPSAGGMQETNCIPEGDMYRLITHSELPSAEKFELWVFDEILPSIRQNGGYIVNQENLSESELLAKAVLVAQNVIAQKDQIIEKQSAKITEDKPKVIFADAVSTSHTSILIGELAKIIKQNGTDMGEGRLFGWLRDKGYLIKRKGTDWNAPTQRSMDLGLFTVKETAISHADGHVTVSKTTKVTGKGQQYFINKFLTDCKGICN